MPRPQLSCFACCPPIRPAGYDHADHRGPMRRFLSDNRAEFLGGGLPHKPMIGFFCPGLGFLDKKGRTAGCLLHPARNQGRDLRELTGYAEKCARETCPEFRAYAALPPTIQDNLISLCQGMDPFSFSSRKTNPVMRLLSFGPEAARAVGQAEPRSLGRLRSWAWLEELDPSLGWLLSRVIEARGPDFLLGRSMAADMGSIIQSLRLLLGPAPPMASGELLHEQCGEWEARFWQAFTGLARIHPEALNKWRAAVMGLVG